MKGDTDSGGEDSADIHGDGGKEPHLTDASQVP